MLTEERIAKLEAAMRYAIDLIESDHASEAAGELDRALTNSEPDPRSRIAGIAERLRYIAGSVPPDEVADELHAVARELEAV